jgi:alpha-glucuronidase
MRIKQIFIFTLLFITSSSFAENGNRLWLRADTCQHADVTINNNSSSTIIAADELRKSWKGEKVNLILTHDNTLGNEGYSIRKRSDGIAVSANTPIGLLYGVYNLLRLQSTNADLRNINITEIPFFSIRILDHWDNLDGSIERGYAGHSLWQWSQLPYKLSSRYTAYARANASVGINGAVINNVNASPKILKKKYLLKICALANVLRPYGIRIYLSVNFASPKVIGNLPTADPLNPAVIAWWKNKVKEIESLIPDFGGFLIKANSEGQPGPGDYHRTHADGANMLADALRPYNGIVMWRTFVYGNRDNDRVKQSVEEFKPLDGLFRSNVIIQIKNGPLDFQPREPYNPLFDNMSHTNMMTEFQITQEYLGQSVHLAYLAPIWHEFYSFVSPSKLKAVAGVSNIGDSINWCGHHFAQSNWYAFGRMAWNPNLTPDQIADEWLQQTFTCDTSFINPVKKIMIDSRETIVNYMMPLGLHHIFKANHHYGPEPWGNQKNFPITWRPVYYHKADTLGIGFDRTTNGTNAVSQYRPPYDSLYNDLSTCPEIYLLWFHHISWTYKMHNGQTLWNELCHKYDIGVNSVQDYIELWNGIRPYIDSERYNAINNKLHQQLVNAVRWKESCLLYFQAFSRLPFPNDIIPPTHSLKELMKDKKE